MQQSRYDFYVHVAHVCAEFAEIGHFSQTGQWISR